jgi:antirestriction protein ArdC
MAELGSCFLYADLGIAPELEPRPDHASYLQSWLTVLSGDKRAIFHAAAQPSVPLPIFMIFSRRTAKTDRRLEALKAAPGLA